jgi:3-oxoacyl-[acyl-carrier protein] reductase
MSEVLKDKIAIVTGAAGTMGLAATRFLLEDGCQVAMVDFNQERNEALAQELGPNARAFSFDISDPDAVRNGHEAIAGAMGAVDILVNNAGGSRPFALDATEAQWHEAIALNFTRPRQLTLALVPQMIERGWGRIINITGKSEPEGINGAFCAKAAMHSFAKGLSREVGRHGITVNSIPPGRILSEQILRNYSPEYREWQSEHEIPVGDYGQPEDIAHLVCFLASPLARYVTGAVIPVDGGLRRYQF